MSFLKRMMGRKTSGSEERDEAPDPFQPARISSSSFAAAKQPSPRVQAGDSPTWPPEIAPEAHDASGLLEDEEDDDEGDSGMESEEEEEGEGPADFPLNRLPENEPARVTSSYKEEDTPSGQVGYSWAKTNSWASDGMIDYGPHAAAYKAAAEAAAAASGPHITTTSFRSHASFGSDVTDFEYMTHHAQAGLHAASAAGSPAHPRNIIDYGTLPPAAPGSVPPGAGGYGGWPGAGLQASGVAGRNGAAASSAAPCAAANASSAAPCAGANAWPQGFPLNDPMALAAAGLPMNQAAAGLSVDELEQFADRMLAAAQMMKSAAAVQKLQQPPLHPPPHLQTHPSYGQRPEYRPNPLPHAHQHAHQHPLPHLHAQPRPQHIPHPQLQSHPYPHPHHPLSTPAAPLRPPVPSGQIMRQIPSCEAPQLPLTSHSTAAEKPSKTEKAEKQITATTGSKQDGKHGAKPDGGDVDSPLDSTAPPELEVPLEERTTVMLRNLPNDYSRDMLLELLNQEGFEGSYDFIYLPQDFKRRAGLGYAFINLVDHTQALRFMNHFRGFNTWRFSSQKICEAAWGAPLQGLDQHIFRYKNSPLMHPEVPDEFKPLLFKDGLRISFPDPTKRIRPPRMKLTATTTAGDGSVGEPSEGAVAGSTFEPLQAGHCEPVKDCPSPMASTVELSF